MLAKSIADGQVGFVQLFKIFILCLSVCLSVFFFYLSFSPFFPFLEENPGDAETDR